MVYDFYNSNNYKKKQSVITKENWKKGIFNFRFKKEKRICARKECGKVFKTTPSNPKIYCSQSCAALVNNSKRGSMSNKQKIKISLALRGRKNPHAGIIRVLRVKIICANPKCKKVFFIERWMKKKFCSNKCAVHSPMIQLTVESNKNVE